MDEVRILILYIVLCILTVGYFFIISLPLNSLLLFVFILDDFDLKSHFKFVISVFFIYFTRLRPWENTIIPLHKISIKFHHKMFVL